jgi:MFS family permease
MAAQNALFWQPVFVLWFSAHLAPQQVLRLEALYFAAVVILEVPSGWASDQLGRRPLLIASSLAWGAGAAAVATGDPWGLAIGQLLLAAGMAFGSGTDSALHADTLIALGREDELEAREANARAYAFGGLALAGAIGGVAGSWSLALPYALSALSGASASALALAFVEPPKHTSTNRPPTRPLRDPVLRWILMYSVLLMVLVHVPYELLQPWLALLWGEGPAPIVAGALVGASMAAGSVAARMAPTLHAKLGTVGALAVAACMQLVLIAAMGAVVHPALVPFLALRSLSFGLADPVLSALIHPRLDSTVRATWLSAQSLAGRLAFALTLAALSMFLGTDVWTPHTLWLASWPIAIAGGLALVGLVVTAPRTFAP